MNHLRLVAVAAYVLAAVALVRDTYYNGHDFEVFWRAGRDLLQGRDPYSLAHGYGMVFKYPPWSLPFFLPWGFLSLAQAKVMWGISEALSLLAVGYWLRHRAHATWYAIFGVGLLYWGLWAVHALDGQIALQLLALALWLWPHDPELSPGWRSTALVWTLSMKVFTGLPLFGFKIERRWVFAILLSVPLLLMLCVPVLVSGVAGGPLELLKHWVAAAGSGGTLMSSEHIRGGFNPSFTGAILSGLQVPANQVKADLALAIALSAFLGGGWAWVSTRLPLADRWAGWLALVPMIHPLPWWHLFVFTFPLAVLAVDRSARAQETTKKFGRRPGLRTLARVLSGLGVFLIGAGTHRFLGVFGLEAVGVFLGRTAGKSFGALFCGVALIVLHIRIQNNNSRI